MIRPAICYEPFVDSEGAAARCRKAPGHEGLHGYGGSRGKLRWFLHEAPSDDPLRPRAEAEWRKQDG